MILPQVEVLCFEPTLTHSVWNDYIYRNRTMTGLVKRLRREVKSGRFVGYRFITIHKTVYGLDKSKPEDLLICPKCGHGSYLNHPHVCH